MGDGRAALPCLVRGERDDACGDGISVPWTRQREREGGRKGVRVEGGKEDRMEGETARRRDRQEEGTGTVGGRGRGEQMTAAPRARTRAHTHARAHRTYMHKPAQQGSAKEPKRSTRTHP